MGQPQVGVQLIIYGRRPQTDLPGVLAEVAAAGYAGIEGGLPADAQQCGRLRTALAQAGLAFAGSHCGLGDQADPARLKERLGYLKALGGRHLISSGSPWKTLNEHLDAAEVLNRTGEVCRGEGVTFCYHNHHWEFRDFGGTTAFHAMIAAMKPEAVKLCPDVYWVYVGGEKPEDFVSRYRDRCPYFHFKDGTGGDQAGEFRELGRGSVDLPAALKAALGCDPDWIVVEQDATQMDPAESNRISREYLRSLGL